MEIEQLKYPIGKFQKTPIVTPAIRSEWIGRIASLPDRLEKILEKMNDRQLDTAYRPGGWSVRQLVHHLADSHLNAHCRVRLALTEENPVIKAYDQDAWVQQSDVLNMPLQPSLSILRGIHARWAFLLQSLAEHQHQRTFIHPEYNKTFSLDEMTGLYAWHGDHHLAQIRGLAEREGWLP